MRRKKLRFHGRCEVKARCPEENKSVRQRQGEMSSKQKQTPAPRMSRHRKKDTKEATLSDFAY